MKLKELAAQAGVSAATVSIVRQGKPGVSAALRRRLQLLLEENGYDYLPYSPAAGQSALFPVPGGENRRICLLKHYRSAMLTDKNEGFVESVIDAIEYAAGSAGYSLVLTAVNAAQYAALLDTDFQSAYDGIIVIATEMTRDEIALLERIVLPAVVLDTDYSYIPHTSVSMNNRKLAWQAVSRLAAAGQVGYLQSGQETGNFAARAIGYSEAVESLGQPRAGDLVFRITPELTQAEKDMDAWLAQGRSLPRALFADNDVIAIGCMRSLLRHGVRIPQDVQIIAVDNTLLAQVITPSLSSVQISKRHMGELSIRLLLEKIASPETPDVHVRIDTQLVCRESLAEQKKEAETP